MQQRGQGATEYMLAISVIVIAIVAAGVPFQEGMKDAVQKFGVKFETYFASSDTPDI